MRFIFKGSSALAAIVMTDVHCLATAVGMQRSNIGSRRATMAMTMRATARSTLRGHVYLCDLKIMPRTSTIWYTVVVYIQSRRKKMLCRVLPSVLSRDVSSKRGTRACTNINCLRFLFQIKYALI